MILNRWLFDLILDHMDWVDNIDDGLEEHDDKILLCKEEGMC